ncbi:MAG: ABC transporter ATP-binding protein [Chitinophagaceae bacterium]|nr:ABC transporter ATP-binding protein [Chitinophagaceae bacterium]
MYPLLQIKNLSVDFETAAGNVTAIQNISFTVNNNETVAIVGESGSGKTVTALSILQLLPVPPVKYITGEILFSMNGTDQTDILKISVQGIKAIRGNGISMIFQEPMTSLNPVHTCGQQVIEAIRVHTKMSYQKAEALTLELFRQVELPYPAVMLHRYPHQVSGGQKQRVMIAMAMSCNPSVLIADEPTTALDVTVQKKILGLIKKLQLERRMGVIYITHDLNLVADIADKVIVMLKGTIVENGNAKDIFLNPQHPYTKALLACRPTIHSKGKRLPVVSDFIPKEGENEKRQLEEQIAVDEVLQNLDPDSIKNESLLSVEHLKIYFPGNKSIFSRARPIFKAVDDVSFEIARGETVGLVGESGCGKTTLGRALVRLIEPASGNIFFGGKNIAHIPTNEMRKMRKKIQIIFQDPYGSLNPRLTIGSALQEPLKFHNILSNDKQRKEKVIDLLEKVGLKAEHFNRYPHEFSGGQRQRICIARALGLNPEFIVCDESISALDVSVQAQVLNLLNDLKAEFGFTALFISHDLNVVRYFCNRIMVMHKGRIIESGDADQIYFKPQNEYTRKLIASIPAGIVI